MTCDPPDMPVDEKAWVVIDRHFGRGRSLVAHQLNGFSEFVNSGIPSVVRSFNPVTINSGFDAPTGRYASVFRASVVNVSLGRCVTQDRSGRTSLVLPSDARLRNMLYSGALTCDIEVCATQESPDGSGVVRSESKTLRGVLLGNVPIMVGSEYCLLSDGRLRSMECPYDTGGYFIINGNEKVVISHDRISENTPFVFSGSKLHGDSLVCEVRSVGERMPGCPKTTSLVVSPRQNSHGAFIVATINSVKEEIPLFVLFRALGVCSDREIVSGVLRLLRGVSEDDLHRELQGCCAEGSVAWTQADALRLISRHVNQPANQARGEVGEAHRVACARGVLESDLFPHVGGDFGDKAVYLSYMVAKLVRVRMGLLDMDDRDSYLNKRVDTPGALLTTLFRQHYAKMLREMRTFLLKELATGTWKVSGRLANLLTKSNVSKIVRHTTVSSGLMYALATGNWGIKNSRCKQGVAQVLNRMTHNATISHLRRVNTPIEKTGKLVQPRKLFATSWGVMCPAETPEGASIGLVKNLALTAVVTQHTPGALVLERLRAMGVAPLGVGDASGDPLPSRSALVLLNGAVVGSHADPVSLQSRLRALRRVGTLAPATSVVWNPISQEVRLSTEAGRCCRPLLVVEDGRALVADVPATTLAGMSIAEMLTGRRSGPARLGAVVEYLDVEEANQSLIAMTPADLDKTGKGALRRRPYTHLELTPAACLGVVASTIPFLNHNQSPRNTYQSAQSKQSVGLYSTAFRSRFDTMAFVLDYPQRPIVNTRMASRLHVDSLPSGMTAVVAIMAHTGFNQEDSVVMSRAAVDRGFFGCTFYRSYKETNSRNHSTGEEECFYKPAADEPTCYPRNASSAKLDATGFVPENTFVCTGDVLVGKCMPQKSDGVITEKDVSVSLKDNEFGFVDANCFNSNRFPTTTSDGFSFCKVRVRQSRPPVIGDKCSSRAGQKSTVGTILDISDMPYSAEGVVPDLIMNPHAIPSRMTLSQLLESVLGKSSCLEARYGDCTPFRAVTPEEVGRALVEHGFERHGDEVLYSPATGLPMKVATFMGPTYYQRLKHMSVDKVHSRGGGGGGNVRVRASGPLASLCRQPAEGRSRQGGLRLGSMEVDACLANATTTFLRERMYNCSDAYEVTVCRQCGCLATMANPAENLFKCVPCANTTAFATHAVPYAFKLLGQELQGLGIETSFGGSRIVSRK